MVDEPAGCRSAGPATGARRAVARTSAAAVLVLAALAGCGESASVKARAVAASFYQALADEDGEKACSLLTPDVREAFDEEGSCAKAFGSDSPENAGATVARVEDAKKRLPSIRRAEVVLRDGGNTAAVLAPGTQLTLKRAQGKWRIATLDPSS